jgi:hypothetical protein
MADTKVTGAGGDDLARSKLSQENLTVYTIPITDWRGPLTGGLILPTGSSNTKMYIASASPSGGNSPFLSAYISTGEPATPQARILLALPPEYVSGETIQFKFRAKRGAAGDANLDLNVYKVDGEGGCGSDICITAAQALTTVYADYTFEITTTGLACGDVLDLMLIAELDNNESIAITKTQMLIDIKG